MSARRTGEKKPDRKAAQKPALDPKRNEVVVETTEDDFPVDSTVIEEEGIEAQRDDWAEFFTEETEGNVVVQMQRILPDVTIVDPETGVEIRTAGYCEDLPAGLPSYQNHIKRRYGGGTYRVQKRVAGRIAKQRYVHIQGKPILEQPPPDAPTLSNQPLPAEEFDGINIGGSDGDWMRRMERLIAMKKLLDGPAQPPAIDQNLLQTLLGFLIEQKTPDPIAQVQTMAALFASVKDLMPDSSTGASMADILNTAVKTVGQLLVTSPRKALPVGSMPVIHRTQIGKHVDNSAVSDGQQTTPEEIDQMSQPPQIRELAGLAIQTIVTNFRLQPPKSADRVVAVLDSSLGMDREQRVALLPFKQVLFDLAEVQLEEDFSADPKQRESFQAYFDAIFDDFVRPDREVIAL